MALIRRITVLWATRAIRARLPISTRLSATASCSPLTSGILSGQAAWLQANPDYAVIIEGHADEQGTREYNLALGARRAAAAQNFLISQGVPASRMRTISYGKERPIEICSDEACYSKNRRAVTVLSMGAGS
jgi:peptidoglycan-associated lipoprotein